MGFQTRLVLLKKIIFISIFLSIIFTFKTFSQTTIQSSSGGLFGSTIKTTPGLFGSKIINKNDSLSNHTQEISNSQATNNDNSIFGIPFILNSEPCQKPYSIENNIWTCTPSPPAELKGYKFRKFASNWKKTNSNFYLLRIYAYRQTFSTKNFNNVTNQLGIIFNTNIPCEDLRQPNLKQFVCKLENNNFSIHQFGASLGGGVGRHSLEVNFKEGFISQKNLSSTSQNNQDLSQKINNSKIVEQNSSSKIDYAEQKCSEIGYKKGTEKYADCVMKLMED